MASAAAGECLVGNAWCARSVQSQSIRPRAIFLSAPQNHSLKHMPFQVVRLLFQSQASIQMIAQTQRSSPTNNISRLLSDFPPQRRQRSSSDWQGASVTLLGRSILMLCCPINITSLNHLNRFGILSTVSVREETQGLPLGSVVEFGLDSSKTYPVFSVSTLSTHTRDLVVRYILQHVGL